MLQWCCINLKERIERKAGNRLEMWYIEKRVST